MNAVISPRPVEVRRSQAAGQEIRRSFVVNLEHGLHARPCAALVKALQPYNLTVDVQANGEQASGKSILGLMALGAAYRSTITFTMSGEKVFEAMDKVEKLFSSNFEVAYHA